MNKIFYLVIFIVGLFLISSCTIDMSAKKSPLLGENLEGESELGLDIPVDKTKVQPSNCEWLGGNCQDESGNNFVYNLVCSVVDLGCVNSCFVKTGNSVCGDSRYGCYCIGDGICNDALGENEENSPNDCGVCTTGETETCNTGIPGICGPGERECVDGSWGACESLDGPNPENPNAGTCDDGLDNDCDRKTDGDDDSCAFYCGDNTINNNEECDGTDLNSKECTDFDYGGGTLACYVAGTENECEYDFSGCTEPPVCGDDIITPLIGEQCEPDPLNLNGKTCKLLGYDEGNLACYPVGNAKECEFDKTGCYNTENCYDGIDNDGDNYVDCADSTCSELNYCLQYPRIICAFYDSWGCRELYYVKDPKPAVDNLDVALLGVYEKNAAIGAISNDPIVSGHTWYEVLDTTVNENGRCFGCHDLGIYGDADVTGCTKNIGEPWIITGIDKDPNSETYNKEIRMYPHGNIQDYFESGSYWHWRDENFHRNDCYHSCPYSDGSAGGCSVDVDGGGYGPFYDTMNEGNSMWGNVECMDMRDNDLDGDIDKEDADCDPKLGRPYYGGANYDFEEGGTSDFDSGIIYNLLRWFKGIFLT